MSFRNKYTDCSGKEFYTNDEPYIRASKNLYHVFAEDMNGVRYLLKFQSIISEDGEREYNKVPLSAKPMTKLDLIIKEIEDNYIVLSDGSLLTSGMKHKDFWAYQNKKYIPIYSHYDFGNRIIIMGFVIKALKLRDFIEISDEKSLIGGYVL